MAETKGVLRLAVPWRSPQRSFLGCFCQPWKSSSTESSQRGEAIIPEYLNRRKHVLDGVSYGTEMRAISPIIVPKCEKVVGFHHRHDLLIVSSCTTGRRWIGRACRPRWGLILWSSRTIVRKIEGNNALARAGLKDRFHIEHGGSPPLPFEYVPI